MFGVKMDTWLMRLYAANRMEYFHNTYTLNTDCARNCQFIYNLLAEKCTKYENVQNCVNINTKNVGTTN